jgi:hypothetical protein
MQSYETWLLKWPAQSVLLTAALAWCRDVTALYKVWRGVCALERRVCLGETCVPCTRHREACVQAGPSSAYVCACCVCVSCTYGQYCVHDVPR